MYINNYIYKNKSAYKVYNLDIYIFIFGINFCSDLISQIKKKINIIISCKFLLLFIYIYFDNIQLLFIKILVYFTINDYYFYFERMMLII